MVDLGSSEQAALPEPEVALESAPEIITMPSRFEEKQDKGNIDVWWLWDDGGKWWDWVEGVVISGGGKGGRRGRNQWLTSSFSLSPCPYLFSGLAILIPFLLSRHKHWKNCKLRIFTMGSSKNIDQAKLRYGHHCV